MQKFKVARRTYHPPEYYSNQSRSNDRYGNGRRDNYYDDRYESHRSHHNEYSDDDEDYNYQMNRNKYKAVDGTSKVASVFKGIGIGILYTCKGIAFTAKNLFKFGRFLYNKRNQGLQKSETPVAQPTYDSDSNNALGIDITKTYIQLDETLSKKIGLPRPLSELNHKSDVKVLIPFSSLSDEQKRAVKEDIIAVGDINIIRDKAGNYIITPEAMCLKSELRNNLSRNSKFRQVATRESSAVDDIEEEDTDFLEKSDSFKNYH